MAFRKNDPLHHENCITLRKNFNDVEFGFPYFDALPVKLSVNQSLDLVEFIENCLNLLEEGAIATFNLAPIDGKANECIIVRRTFGSSLHVDIAFTDDYLPVMVPIEEVLDFKNHLKDFLNIKSIDGPIKEDAR